VCLFSAELQKGWNCRSRQGDLLDQRIEPMISICRNHSANVKNRQNGNMALRWCVAGLVEADKLVRRVNGHMHRQRYEPPSNGMSPIRVSVPTIMMRL
jgi:hypothetical protein